MWAGTAGTVARFETSLCPSAGRHASLRSILVNRICPCAFHCGDARYLDSSGLKSLRMTPCLGNLLKLTRFIRRNTNGSCPICI